MVKNVSGCPLIIHYLDFLCIDTGKGDICSLLLHTIEQVAGELEVPLVQDKTEDPTMVLGFLGIVIDTEHTG